MSITVLKDGPYLVNVDEHTILSDARGQPFNIKGKEKVALCRCGFSKNAPFCDGKHRQVGFQNEVSANKVGE